MTAERVTEALEPGLRTRGFIFNTLLADKATKDRLRSYEHWLASRNLSNEASDESVAALIEAVVGRYEIARRWYRLKARLLGLERLAHYDRMAPLELDERTIGYGEARELVLDCYRGFSGELGDVAAEFFTGSYIDAPPAPGKRGGAFCSYTVPSRHPYVMLNYTSRPGDVLTMAHELGHGVHAALARPKGIFEFSTPLTVAETASIFGESIVLGRLLAEAPDAEGPPLPLCRVARRLRRRGLPPGRDEPVRGPRSTASAATRASSRSRPSTPPGSTPSATCSATPSTSPTTTATWWSYVPHFVDTPGYVYAYAYGNLLALSVYRRYEEEGEGFVDSYLDLLRAGGSAPPEELGKIVGVDLTDPGFWNAGLDLIERRLEEAEAVAAEA